MCAIRQGCIDLMRRAAALDRERGFTSGLQEWRKEQHLERMRTSGRFRYVREITLHHMERGSAERLVGLAMSQGQVASLLNTG